MDFAGGQINDPKLGRILLCSLREKDMSSVIPYFRKLKQILMDLMTRSGFDRQQADR